jgi:hypothetical protein
LPVVAAITGKWPDAAWAAMVGVTGNGNSLESRFFRWRKDHWAPVGKPAVAAGAARWVVFPWKDDGIAALKPSVFGPTRVVAFSASSAAIPTLTRAVQSKLERDQYRCDNVMIAPEAWARLAPGDELIFSGQLCGAPSMGPGDVLGTRRLGLERLRAGQKQGEVTLLPMPSEMPPDMTWNVDGVAALSQTDALLAAHGTDNRSPPEAEGKVYGYIAHWDGTAWSIEHPPIDTFRAVWAHAGAYWAKDSAESLWLRRNGRWSVVGWTGGEPRDSAAAWRNGYVSQILGDDQGATWLLHKQPSGATNISRLYRVRFVEAAE